MRRPLSAAALTASLIALGCLPFAADAAPGDVNVEIVTSAGTMEVALDPVHAPNTTKNFLRLVDAKFYDGGTFFRAVPGFVIQGGNRPREKDNDPAIKLEAPVKTGVHNLNGTIAMARTNDPNSATSEFFLDDGDQARLDGTDAESGYAAFGHVTKNVELIAKIARMPAEGQALLEPVKIVRIRRVP